jgi:hypothetical protein
MTSQVNINELVPNFQLPATSNITFQLSDRLFLSKRFNTRLYYPRHTI